MCVVLDTRGGVSWRKTLKDWMTLQVAGSPVPFYEKSLVTGRSLMEFGERKGVSSGDLSAQYGRFTRPQALCCDKLQLPSSLCLVLSRSARAGSMNFATAHFFYVPLI